MEPPILGIIAAYLMVHISSRNFIMLLDQILRPHYPASFKIIYKGPRVLAAEIEIPAIRGGIRASGIGSSGLLQFLE